MTIERNVDVVYSETPASLIKSNPLVRIKSLDLLRAWCLLGMAFIHCREFIKADNYSNLEWDTPALWQGESMLDFIQQTFISVLVSSGFFMLMGIGITFFYRSRKECGWSVAKICRFLAVRGAVLIVIQMTVLQFLECYIRGEFFIYIGVLAALGGCMILSALIIYLIHLFNEKLQPIMSIGIPIVISIAVLIGVHYFINQVQAGSYKLNAVTFLLFMSGHYPFMNLDLDVNFTPIPWLPAVAIGMIIGELLVNQKSNTLKMIFNLGLTLVISFFIIRLFSFDQFINLGDYKLLHQDATDWLSLFCISKYPPSFCFYLWSLGINLILVAFFCGLERRYQGFTSALKPIIHFGQCSLLFFVLHWFVYLGLASLFQIETQTLFGILSFWSFGLIILYPICFYYHKFKLSQPAESLWRLF